MLKKIITVFLFLSLAACQTTLHDEPGFTEASPPDENHALLYLFRIGSTPFYVSAPMYIDGNKVIDMPNRGYTPVYLKPGQHTISIKWDFLSGQKDVETMVTLEAGKTHYVALTKPDVTNLKVILDPNSHYLGEFNRENAIGGISQCKLAPKAKPGE